MKHIPTFKNFLNESYPNGSIKSINDIMMATEHLYPNANIRLYKGTSEFSGIKFNTATSYVYVSGAKDYLILTYDKSDHSSNFIGVVWLNGNPNSGLEFSTIQDLEDIVSRNKMKI